jgi:hypothetical protein
MLIKVGDERGHEDLALEGGRGILEQREVDAVMGRHLKELSACGEQAGPARRYVEGEVGLRFFVSAEGEVSQVLVLSSSVGNFAVERCLVEEGLRILMPRPRGHKGSDFQYSLQFRASGEMGLTEWPDDKVARQVAQLSPRLGPCGELGPAPVKAVLYIEPGGQVGSVGLASPSPLDPEAAGCAVEQIRRWRLCGGRRGPSPCAIDRHHVVRTSFQVAAPAAAPPRPPVRLVRRTPRRRAP